MSYYHLLGLEREPFSTSPDPDFFYLSSVHSAAFYRLRTAIELKRGLSIVVGDIGTGKTTLARRLSQVLYEDPRMDFHVILNPFQQDEEDFLKNLLSVFHLADLDSPSPIDCLRLIERYLFQKGVEEGKTVVLLIDEAQHLSMPCLEMLRILLNYETNKHKLLQLVLVGQMELVDRLKQMRNFWDRINLKIKISPLNERAMREMVEYRLRQANYSRDYPLFQPDALRFIFRKTKGFPRRITMLCHDALEYLVMMNHPQVNKKIIKEAADHEVLLKH